MAENRPSLFGDDRELTYRAAMLPIGTYRNEDGSESVGWAWPGMISEPYNAFQRLAENSITEDGRLGIPNPQNPDNQRDVMTGLFSLYGGNALNPAARLPKNAIGMFAGRRAKTADQGALARAEELAAKGAPREQIWNETGWFQGPDQKWRFEIDDSDINYVIPAKEWISRPEPGHQYMAPNFGQAYKLAASQLVPEAPVRMKRIFSHPDLDAAYDPSIMQTPVALMAGGRSSGSLLNNTTIGLHETLPPREAKSTALHEMQHIVQGKEGFASGASPDEFIYQNSPMFAYRRSWEDPSDTYRRVAGEAEARAVQKRMDLTPQERGARPPWLDYDVPEDQQIVRFRSDTGKPSLF